MRSNSIEDRDITFKLAQDCQEIMSLLYLCGKCSPPGKFPKDICGLEVKVVLGFWNVIVARFEEVNLSLLYKLRTK